MATRRIVLGMLGVALLAAPLARAEAVYGAVSYSPTQQTLDGLLPLTRSYTLTLTSPANYPAGLSKNISFRIEATGAPVGVGTALARTFISYSPQTVTFNGPGQSATVTVTVNILSLIAGNYGYQIYSQGWPTAIEAFIATGGTSTFNPASQGFDQGASIDAAVSLPGGGGPSGPPPVTTITSPAKPLPGATKAYIDLPADTVFPITVPLVYNVTSETGWPITQSSANYSGVYNNGASSFSSTPLNTVRLSGIGTTRVDGTTAPLVGDATEMSIPGVGTYTVRATGTNANGADDDVTEFEVRIVGRPALVVTAENKSRTYGSANPTLTYTITGLLDGDVLADVVTGVPAITSPASALSPVGFYDIKAALGTLASTKYSFEFVDATLEVKPAPLTITADNKSKAYGAENPTLTYNVTGFVNNENLTISDVTGAPTLSTTATLSSPVLPSGSSYPIVPVIGTLASTNYYFVFVDGALVITPAKLTVTAKPATKVYGDPLPLFASDITGFINGDTLAVVSGAPAHSTTATIGSLPGGYPIVPLPGTLSASNYTFEFVESILTVTKALLTFTADDKSRKYGEANPALTHDVTGFVNGDTEATAFTGSPALSTLANPSSGVAGSPYTISIAAGTLASAKYDFAFVPGKLTITRAPLVVKADDKTKDQGVDNPALTYTVTGFVLGENASVLSGQPALTTTAVKASPAGNYPISINAGSLSAANYTFSYIPGTLTVKQVDTAPQTVAGIVFFDVNANGVRNPDEPPLPGITVKLYNKSNNQLVDTDVTDVNGAYSFTVPPGAYEVDAIEIVGLTPTTADEHVVTVADANVTVPDIGLGLDLCAIRNLNGAGKSHGYWKSNISKANAGKKSGVQESKADLHQYTDVIGSLFLSPFSALSMEQAEWILSGGDQLSLQLLAAEYNFVSSRLINNSTLLTGAFIYWGECVLKNASSYSSSYKEFVKDWMDAFNNSYGGKVDGPCDAPTPRPRITITTPDDGDEFSAGTGATVNVPFSFTTTINTGFTISAVSATLNGVPISGLNTSGLGTINAVSSTTLQNVPVGTHTLKAFGTGGGITVTDTVTIKVTSTGSRPTLTVLATDKTKVYGAPNPALTYTITGFQSGDSAANSVTGSPVLATSAVTGSAPGTYAISIAKGSLTSSKYDLVFENGDLIVTKAKLTFTALDASRAYGAANPTFNFSVSGFVNGDNASSGYTGLPALGTTATASSAAGSYPITIQQGSLSSSKYTFHYVNGTLTVTAVTPASYIASGKVFFDVNCNGSLNTDEPWFAGITVKLYKNNQYVRSLITGADGKYSFEVTAGSYEIDVLEPAGLKATTADERKFTVASKNVSIADVGLGLYFSDIKCLNGDGKSHGYWKSNIQKAKGNKTSGVQETKANLQVYTNTISTLMLSPYAGLTLPQAESTLSSSDQLKLQLLAAQYNYASNRLINDSKPLTFAFIYWGEYVVKNATSYSSSYESFVKDWMDAFNNSYGGRVDGPLP